MSSPLVVVGDTVLDRDIEVTVSRLCPDAPAPVCDVVGERARPGGAGLAALLAAQAGPVLLVTALADDDGGELIARRLTDAGVELHAVPLAGPTPEKVRVRSGPHTFLRIDRGAEPGTVAEPSEEALEAMSQCSVLLVSDYGRGLSRNVRLRDALARAAHRHPVVWDPHPRGPEPVPGVHLVTPNLAEAAAASGVPGDDMLAAVAQGRELTVRWDTRAVVVTMGARGAMLCTPSRSPLYIPAAHAAGDTCGAGDRFAVAAASALGAGALLSEAVEAAVREATEFVVHGGVAALAVGCRALGENPPTDQASPVPEPFHLAAQARTAGKVCVATGGCFDLLHAGHVSMLKAARGLGDCLIVCLNSDESVRRLKGAGRPRQSAADRAAILLELDCVDAVAMFDEDTPVELLKRLRPHVFAKGSDYDVAALPETAAMSAWGGHTVALPYLSGRSTTRLLAQDALHGT